MRRIDLDAATWSTVLDFYDALLKALGAPDWHCRSIGALVDTMIWHDEINAVSPPYTVAISNATSLHPEIRAEIGDLAQALRDARAEFSRSERRDVDVQLDVI